MQNKAQWLETTPDGYKIRVQVIPATEAEHKRVANMLMNPSVRLIGTPTTQGPLSFDIFLSPKDASGVVDIAPLPKVDPDGDDKPLTKAQAKALAKAAAKQAKEAAAPSADDLDAAAKEQEAADDTK